MAKTNKNEKKEWTIMVYMAADNNLDENGADDLKKMKRAMRKAGAGRRINLIAQYDRALDGVPTKRFVITGKGSVEDDVVKEIRETNTGNPKVLIRFLRWSIKNYPARRYMVVLWNHGNGVEDDDIYFRGIDITNLKVKRSPFFRPSTKTLRELPILDANRLIGTDDHEKDFLDNVELQMVFDTIRNDRTLGLDHNIDIVLMDACLMSMVEVYFQLRNSVDLVVGAEDIGPVKGWPYVEVFSKLIDKPDIKTQALARQMVNQYMSFYADDSHVSLTQSACDLRQFESVKLAIDKLAQALLSSLSEPGFLEAFIVSHYQAQTYNEMKYVDLIDLCTVLKDKSTSQQVGAACQSTMDTLGGSGFILNSRHKGDGVEFSNGVSIYLPRARISPLYQNLDFIKQTEWGNFLSAYMEKKSRRARGVKKENV
jgi:hypothetical protein